MKTAYNSIKRGLLESIRHAEGLAPQTPIYNPRPANAMIGYSDMEELKALKVELLADPETRAEYDAIANELATTDNQKFSSVWDAIEDDPEQAARMRALSEARMFGPPHPGLKLRNDVLPALGLSVTKASKKLGVTRLELSRVLHGQAPITPQLAQRIEAWLGVEHGGDARLWLAEQSAYYVWQAAQRFKTKPMHVQPAPAMTA